MGRAGAWLAAPLVILGLFLMHGITADHSMPVPMASMPVVQGATMHPASALVADSTGLHPAVPGQATTDGFAASPVRAVGHAARAAVATMAATAGSELSPMPFAHAHGIGACLALLGAVVLLPFLRRRRQVRRALARTLAQVILAADLAHPPWKREPSLSRLCVSRT